MRYRKLIFAVVGCCIWTISATHGLVPSPNRLIQQALSLGGYNNINMDEFDPSRTWNNVVQQVETITGSSSIEFLHQ